MQNKKINRNRKIHKKNKTNHIMFSCTKNIILTLVAIYFVVIGIQFIQSNSMAIGVFVELVRHSINSFFKPSISLIKENLLTLFTVWGLLFFWLFTIYSKLKENYMTVPKFLIYSLLVCCFVCGILFLFWGSSLTTGLSVFIVMAFGMFLLVIPLCYVIGFFQERHNINEKKKLNPEQFELFRKRKLF